MSWLLRNGEVLAAVDERDTGWGQPIRGAMVKRGPSLVHTFGCHDTREMAWCDPSRTTSGDECLTVRRITVLPRRRIAGVSLKGVLVVAHAGAFERWDLHVGDRLEVKDT
ncbi:MAG: hypothetical protein KGQ66_07805 [Acidobacteriota bacterium]|nr:hypothetical protein [Acidobacteriota bacterium]